MMKKWINQIVLAIITGLIFLTCNNPFFPGTPPEGPIKTYTVLFHLGGTLDDQVRRVDGNNIIIPNGFPQKSSDIVELHLTKGAKIPKLPALKRADGYGFGGWFTDKNCTAGNEWNFNSAVTKDISLWAKWSTPSYTVTFKVDGVDVGSTIPELAAHAYITGALVVEPPPITNPDTTVAFDGWYKDTSYNQNQKWNFAIDKVTGNLSLYARWYPLPPSQLCTVTFDARSSSITSPPSPQTIRKGGKIVEPHVMRQDGYAFCGWHTANGDLWDFAKDTASQDMTLYAEWNIIYYTVEFDMKPRGNATGVWIYGGGDQSPPTQTIAYGGLITEPNDMTINNMALGNGKGYGFDGWWYNGDPKPWKFKAYTVGSSYTTLGTTTITLYPRWRKDETFTGGGIAVWSRDGSFTMGNNSVSGSKPAHDVTVTGFYIASYLVTQKQYIAVMGYNPSKNEIGDDYPVVGVTWLDAIEYCIKLTDKENTEKSLGLSQAYSISGRTPASGYPITGGTVTVNWSANGYRLPTEAEWEYAARGGNGSPGNYEWAGSNTPTEVAWFSGTGGNSGGKTHPVGQKKPNILRTYDMSGNVCEWCWDWFDSGYYSNSGAGGTDPKGPDSGTNRVRRGGSWNHGSANTRTFIRDSYDPTAKDVWTIGFRIVRKP